MPSPPGKHTSELHKLNISQSCRQEKDKVPVGPSTRLAGADLSRAPKRLLGDLIFRETSVPRNARMQHPQKKAPHTRSLHPRYHRGQHAAFPDMRISLLIWSSDPVQDNTKKKQNNTIDCNKLHVLYSTILHYTMQCNTIQYSTMYCTEQRPLGPRPISLSCLLLLSITIYIYIYITIIIIYYY